MNKKATSYLLLFLLLMPIAAHSELSENRKNELECLRTAYLMLQQNDPSAFFEIKKALNIDPNLACVNIVRAQYAMVSQDWKAARAFFEIGLKHLHEPDQPLSLSSSVVISAKEVEGDVRVFLGYTYLKLAQMAKCQRSSGLEKYYLEYAKINLEKGLKLNPGARAEEMAIRLLKMFR